jgi:hypothetical protein
MFVSKVRVHLSGAHTQIGLWLRPQILDKAENFQGGGELSSLFRQVQCLRVRQEPTRVELLTGPLLKSGLCYTLKY